MFHSTKTIIVLHDTIHRRRSNRTGTPDSEALKDGGLLEKSQVMTCNDECAGNWTHSSTYIPEMGPQQHLHTRDGPTAAPAYKQSALSEPDPVMLSGKMVSTAAHFTPWHACHCIHRCLLLVGEGPNGYVPVWCCLDVVELQ